MICLICHSVSTAKIHEDFYPRFSEEVLEKCLSDFEMSVDIDFKQLSMGQKKKVYMSFCTCYRLSSSSDG